MDSLKEIFHERFHGAANIKGIHFQLLYSLSLALKLKGDEYIQFEGIEDIDFKGIKTDNCYIQVKYASRPWSISNLKDTIKSFYSTYKLNKQSMFKLIFNFDIGNELEKLVKSDMNLETAETKKYMRYCNDLGISVSDAKELFKTIQFKAISENELMREIHALLYEQFGKVFSIEQITLSLLGQCLEWAKCREQISYSHIAKHVVWFEENIYKEKSFAAYAESLISKICWEKDKDNKSFYDGKGARPTHIASFCDAPRQKWLEAISKAFQIEKTCIVKSSSGQGKSTLMYRYAYDNWALNEIFSVNACNTPENANKIADYLKVRNKLGFITYIIIDDAGFNNREWPLLVKLVSDLQVQFLIGSRHDDWHRYSKLAEISYEIIQPDLTVDEAKQIFSAFKKKEIIHHTIESPLQAYEMLDEPKLLIEYTYLITQGKMLKERLEEQVRQLAKEDRNKIDLIRKITAAHKCGAYLDIEKYLEKKAEIEPTELIESIKDEFIITQDHKAIGLHWVRSNHLFDILHKDYLRPLKTFKETFEMISVECLNIYIMNVIHILDENDIDSFLEFINMNTNYSDISNIAALLEGIFKGGELKYVDKIKPYLIEASESLYLGQSGVELVLHELLSSGSSGLLDILSKEDNAFNMSLNILRNIVTQIEPAARGKDYLAKYIKMIPNKIIIKDIHRDLQSISAMFDFIAFAEVSNKVEFSMEDFDFERFNIKELRKFLLSVYKYSPNKYINWFDENRITFINYLKYSLDLISLEMTTQEIKASYLTNSCDIEITKINNASMQRINSLRSLCPRFKTYSIYVEWVTYIENAYDPSIKSIPVEHLPDELSIEKNVFFRTRCLSLFQTSSMYDFQKYWFDLRKRNIELIKLITPIYEKLLQGKNPRYDNERVKQLKNDILSIVKWIPSIPSYCKNEIQLIFKPDVDNNPITSDWANDLSAFYSFFFMFQSSKEDNQIETAIYHLKNLYEKLDNFHSDFRILFMSFEDYFNATTLDIEERKFLKILIDILTIQFIHKPKKRVININKYLDQINKNQVREYKKITAQIVKRMNNNGYKIEALANFIRVNKFRYLVFLLHVESPLEVINDFSKLIECSLGFSGKFEFICMIPFMNNSRWHDQCHILSNIYFNNFLNNEPDTMLLINPRDIPKEVSIHLAKYKIDSIPTLELLGYNNAINHQIEYAYNLYSIIGQHLADENKYASLQRKKVEEVIYEKITLIKELATAAVSFIGQDLIEFDTDKLLNFYNEISGIDELQDFIDFAVTNKIELTIRST